MKKFAAICVLLFASLHAWGTACNTTTFGSYGCKQKSQCAGTISGTTTTCTFVAFNSTSDFIYGKTWTNGSGASNTLSGCASVTWTQIAPASGTLSGLQLWKGVITSTTSCTLTITSSVGSSTINGFFVEISGTNGTLNGTPTTATPASYTSGATFSCAALTTTVSGDLVFCFVEDTQGNAGTVTAGSGFAIASQDSYGGAGEGQSQASAGAITPQLTYSSNAFLGGFTFAIEPTGGGSSVRHRAWVIGQ